MDNKLKTRFKRQGKREEGREKRGQDEERMRHERQEAAFRDTIFFPKGQGNTSIQKMESKTVRCRQQRRGLEKGKSRQISRIKNLKHWKIGLNVKT
jgi:hypothetical protein